MSIHNLSVRNCGRAHLGRLLSAMRAWLKAETLVCALAVGVALLGTMQGREPSAPQSMAADSGKVEVRIDNFSFVPKEITVAAGTTVTWTNEDDVPHLVVSADDQFKKSPVLDTNESFSCKFTTAGSYVYFCSIHPHMTGKVIVQ